MIIGLSGYLKSGKDTAGRMITDMYSSFKVKKFADKLKEMAALMLGVPREMFEDQEYKDSYLPKEWDYYDWDNNKMTQMTVREFLQRFGTDAIRNMVHMDAWVNAAMSGYKEGDNWLFTDVRFPNEAQAIKNKGGVVIRLNRYPPGVSPVFMDMHESEKSLDDWKFDYTIYNLGTLEDLRNQLEEIMDRINKVNLVKS